MQFKLILALFVFGYASSAVLSGKTIKVNGEHRIHIVSHSNGAEVDIIKNGLNYEVTFDGPKVETKTVHITGYEGAHHVFEKLIKHEGHVDNLTWDRIVREIEQHVQQGEVNPKFFYVLEFLNNQEAIEYFTREHHHYGQQYGHQYHQGVYGQQYYQGEHYGHHYGYPEHYGQGVYNHQGFYGHPGYYHQQGYYGPGYYNNRGYYGPGYYQHQYQYGVHGQTPVYGKHYYGQQNQEQEVVEDIVNKEAKIEALNEAQEKYQVAKQVLGHEIAQEEKILHHGEYQQYQHGEYAPQYQGYGYGKHYNQYYGNEHVPFVYQHPSVWNKVFSRVHSTPYYYGNQYHYGQYHQGQNVDNEVEYGHYGQHYGQQYGQHYGQQYGPYYGKHYGQQYEQQYGQQYGPHYGQQYGQHYGQQYGKNYYGQHYSQYYPQGQHYGYGHKVYGDVSGVHQYAPHYYGNFWNQFQHGVHTPVVA